MGVYSNRVLAQWRLKLVARILVQRTLHRVFALVPRGLLPKKGVQLTKGPTGSERWDERVQFIASYLSAGQSAWPTFSDGMRSPRVLHFIGSLQPGGAERQLCNCAIGQKNLGMDVSVLLLRDSAGEHGHYENMLRSAGVRVKVAGKFFNPEFKIALARIPDALKLLTRIPPEFCPMVIDVFGELLVDPPDVFHSWLDHPNIWGGVAAVLAGLPRIVLSTRNVNPTHFPYLASPYLLAMYRQFALSNRIRFINNSHVGANDYVRWLGVSSDKFSVVLNGVDFSSIKPASEAAIHAFREEIGIPQNSRMVAGVFRLSEEKQPLIFLEVARQLIARHDDLYVVIAGIGPYEGLMREFIASHGLECRILMLGRRTDVPTIFSTAELKLLCSRQEGTPNVLLEAQWLACPVVSTRAGGAVDAVKDGETGFLVDVGDVDELVTSANRILENPRMRSRMSAYGPLFIQDVFGVNRMVQETLEIYFS
jgi:glycosyltransferase involved in cell wall biosynthesis